MTFPVDVTVMNMLVYVPGKVRLSASPKKCRWRKTRGAGQKICLDINKMRFEKKHFRWKMFLTGK